MAKQIRTGLLGAGVFAAYHARKIADSDHTDFVGLFDADPARAEDLARLYQVQNLQSQAELLDVCDAVVIATPARTHGALVRDALKKACHVLVEKPLALDAAEARALADLAVKSNLILQVGHQERLVCEALGLFDIAEPPKILAMVRAGPPPKDGRGMDVSVVWDLMIHDVDLAHRLLGPEGTDKTCQGTRELGDELDRAVASMTIGETRVELDASRIAKGRKRTLYLEYEQGSITLDFLARTVRNTSKHTLKDGLVNLVPDPLGAADKVFFKACQLGTPPLMTPAELEFPVATAEKLESLGRMETGI